MKIKLLSAMIICTASAQVSAEASIENSPYWLNVNGDYVTDRNGHCVRTINWTPEQAIASCEGGEDEVSDVAAASTADDSAAKESSTSDADSGATAAAAAAASADEEPEVETISLAAGATFELGGSTLSDEGKAAVAELVAQFKERNVTVKEVTIEGHTDSSGDAAFNQQLSEQRAEAVKAEVVANGGNPDKIKTIGYGESKPIADNSTREGRAQNRRVEIKVELDQPKQ